MLKIGVTGHRDLADIPSVTKDIQSSLSFFQEIDKELIAISALAAGADMIVAEEVLKMQIPLRVILPFDPEEYRKDFSLSDQGRLDFLLSQSQETLIATTGKIISDDMREQAYLASGKQIVDVSDVVLAIWDGNPARGTGGTADIIDYARSQEKELHVLRAQRLPTPSNPARRDPILELFQEYDSKAIYYKKKKFEPAWITGIVAGIAAVFSFAIGKSFSLGRLPTFILTVGEFLFLTVSFISLAVYAKRWKIKFLEQRRSAEYLRSILWYQQAGLPIPAAEGLRYQPASEILALERSIAAQLTTIKNVSNARRIAWCLAHDQIRYHDSTRIAIFRSRLKNLDWALHRLKITFFVLTPVNFLCEILRYFNVYRFSEVQLLLQITGFISLVIPPLYTALEGVKYFSEWKRDIAISEKTISDLQRSKQDILRADNEILLLQETKKLRDVLELENIDWTVRYHEKEVGAKV